MKVCINGVWKQVKDENNNSTPTLSSSVAFGTATVAYSDSNRRTVYYGIPIKSGVSVGQKYLAYGSKLQTFITGRNYATQSGIDTINVPVPIYYESTVTQEMINKGYFYVGSSVTTGSAASTTSTVSGISQNQFAIVFLL